jgi:hypothetical protein
MLIYRERIPFRQTAHIFSFQQPFQSQYRDFKAFVKIAASRCMKSLFCPKY